jgi:hypothetical protein
MKRSNALSETMPRIIYQPPVTDVQLLLPMLLLLLLCDIETTRIAS